MKRRGFLMVSAAVLGAAPVVSAEQRTARRRQPTSAMGPLRVHPTNPRYFANKRGQIVYLTGSHTWSNLQDMGPTDPPKPFDFNAYLDFLQQHNHNFIRLWRWEEPRWRYGHGSLSFCEPHPWPRTGPGTARDGKPKFDLTKFTQSYFDRLRERCSNAARRGIHVSIMLFEGHCVQFAEEGWVFHPFHPDNNVNGIDGGGRDYYTLKSPKVLALQEAYVRKVIDTVNSLDNVLYEISNEAGGYSTEWQYHIIRFVKEYEAKKAKQHPVGMTFQYQGGTNANLLNSPADWISPNPDGGYRDDPPPNDGKKVVLNDTDHLWGEGGNPQWVWKSFTRGHCPVFMDRIAVLVNRVVTWSGQSPAEDIPEAEAIRKAMGATRRLAERMDLAEMRPMPDLASSRYCLAAPGKEYVLFLPGGGEVTVDLSAANGALRAEWVHPLEGTATPAGSVQGGAKQTLKAPFAGDAVLCLRRG